MVESFLSTNIMFTYGAFILLSALSVVYIPALTPIILGVTGLAWVWFRQKSSASYGTPISDTVTWASVYEKLEKNTSDVRYLSRLRLDSTQQQRGLLDGLQHDLETLTNEFSTYRSTHEKDLDRAVQSLHARQEQNDALKLDIAMMTKTINALRLKSSDQEQHHQSALQTLNTWQLDKDGMVKQLAAMEQMKLGLEQDLATERQARETDRQTLASLEDTLDQLEQQHLQLQNDSQATMEQHTKALQHEKESANQALEALRLENNSLTEKLAAMQHKDDSWHQQTTTFEQQLEALTLEKTGLEQRLGDMEQEKTNHALQMDTLRQEIDSLRNDKERTSNAMDEMIQEMAVIKDRNQNLTLEQHQQVESTERERDELKEQLDNEKRKTERLELFVRENNNELHRVAEEAVEYQQQVEDLKEQLEQQQDQCADMEQQMNELSLNLHEKHMVLVEMQGKEEQLLAELDEIERKLEHEHELASIMERIQQHMVDLEQLEKDKETVVMELETLEESKKIATMDLEALENDKCKLSAALKKSWPLGEGSSWHEQIPRSPHVVYPVVKASRSSSIPRLSNTNLTFSRSKSSRLATSGATKSMPQQELYQTVRRLEGVIAELQRQLDDSHAQLEDREQRLCHFLSNDTVR